MKKLLLALALGAAIFGAVFATAASLGLSTDNLGADDLVVDTCDSSVGVTYQTAYSATEATYIVTSITLTSIDNVACAGQQITATLSGTGNASLTEVSEACCAGTSQILEVTDIVNPEDVLGVHVVITGPAGA